MGLTDFIGVFILLIYVAIPAFLLTKVDILQIGQPQNGKLCTQNYIKFDDQFQSICSDNCSQQNVQINSHQHIHLQNQVTSQQLTNYDNKICLPQQKEQFIQIEQLAQKPLYIIISQQLKEDLFNGKIIITITLSFGLIFILLSYFSEYFPTIAKHLNQSYIIFTITIIICLIHQLSEILEAEKIINSKDTFYDQGQIKAIFNLSLELPYQIIVGCFILLTIIFSLDQLLTNLPSHLFTITQWFSQLLIHQQYSIRSTFILSILQVFNFIIFYLSCMLSLSLTQNYTQNIYGQLDIIGITSLGISFLIFILFSITFCFMSQLIIFSENQKQIKWNLFGSSVYLSMKQIFLYPYLLIQNMRQYCQEDGFDLFNNQESFSVISLINYQQHDQQLVLNGKKILYLFNNIVNKVALSIALVQLLILLLFNSIISSILFSSFLTYTLIYISIYPLVLAATGYCFNLNHDNRRIEKYLNCLTFILQI